MKPQDNTEVQASGVIGSLTWILNNDTLTISGCGTMPEHEYSDNDIFWYPYRNFITTVIIGNGITSIKFSDFKICKNLVSIFIPQSVTEINCLVIDSLYWQDLSSINVDNDNSAYSSENGILFNKDKTELLFYPKGKSDENYIIPNSVTNIKIVTFSECCNLTSVTIPNSIIEIEDMAFSYSNLTSINVDDDNPAYSSENGILFNKDKTVLIQYPLGKTGSYIIPNIVTGVRHCAFLCCKNLTSITIPNSIEWMDCEAFSGCSSLTSIIIPDSITFIEDYTFYNCSSLISITIPNSVQGIGNEVFKNCTSLMHIYLQNKLPPTIECDTFEKVDKDTCILHVPIGSKDKYANAEGWKEFKNIEEDIEINIEMNV